MFVKKSLQVVKAISCEFAYITHIGIYSMTPTILFLFFAYEYKKYAEFYTDSKSVEIIGIKCIQKKLFAKNFWK